jgi:hypothetical protein
MSRKIRNAMIAILLGSATMSGVSTALAPIVHAEDVDCSKAENKDGDACKK